MKPRHAVVVFRIAAVLCLLMFVSLTGYGRPSAPRITLPGEAKGRVESYWVAPYVRATTERVGARGTTTVRWFDEVGRVLQDVSGNDNRGYVATQENGVTTIYGVCERWKISLPDKKGRDRYHTATDDSRTYLYELCSKEAQIAVDVYLHGKLVNTIGPFLQFEGDTAELSNDGSFSLPVLDSATKQRVTMVVVGPDGKMRFQVECAPPSTHSAAPDGIGVLIGSKTGNQFTYYTAAGKESSMVIEPNPTFIGWVPGTNISLFSISLGDEQNYTLIDWTTGKALWKKTHPINGHMVLSESTVILKDKILFGGYQRYQSGSFAENVITVLAVNLEDGRDLAQWWPSPRGAIKNHGRFLRIADKLFFVTPDEFSELNLKDIETISNGWERVQRIAQPEGPADAGKLRR